LGADDCLLAGALHRASCPCDSLREDSHSVTDCCLSFAWSRSSPIVRAVLKTAHIEDPRRMSRTATAEDHSGERTTTEGALTPSASSISATKAPMRLRSQRYARCDASHANSLGRLKVSKSTPSSKMGTTGLPRERASRSSKATQSVLRSTRMPNSLPRKTKKARAAETPPLDVAAISPAL